ncbi:carbamoyl-phosphate synthase L chain, ATP binding domain-containing protein [Mycena floridula]|nr:carbamoyl-phosphate synthase L chain, ATP binding domain-containing protein [Mycena floridula]
MLRPCWSKCVQAVASTSFIHTSAVVGAQLSTKAKKQRKQERYTAALALKPSVFLGHRAGEESKWLECDLAKVLVDEQQLRVPQPPLPVEFNVGTVQLPQHLAYGISREETHALFGILPEKSTERHLMGVTDSKELNAMEQNATKAELEKAKVFAKVVDLRNADAGGIAYENRRRIIVAFSTPKNPFDSGRTEVQGSLPNLILATGSDRNSIAALLTNPAPARFSRQTSGTAFTRNFASASGLGRRPHFDKILIANRGEIACRVIRTAKKLGIRTVAVYSDVDKDALHVEMADEAYCIGPAPSSQSYLRMDKIIEICHRSGAQAVHPGYGFLSENAKFSELLAQEGIVFIGPPASAIVSMGSKSESKNIMSAANVPCVPGYHGEHQDPDFLFQQAQEIGFPVLIKATHGGGGKGMRIVSTATPEAFNEALSSAQRESLKAFGDDTVLVEKYIEQPRHVEVQVFADTLGNVVSLWERDCSVQRRNQKIIEEAPGPRISPELRANLSGTAVAAAKAVNYVGAGTVEFIFDNETGLFYFMEMNTRLQVEHPVTEGVTGLDLVEWQLEVAAGNPLPLTQNAIPLIGHAFEARIYAENPRNNFLPDSGSLVYLATPTPTHTFAASHSEQSTPSVGEFVPASLTHSTTITPSVRLEQGFTQGSQIGVFYDPMIAKLIVHGSDRTEALRMLRKALDEYHVVGVSTNIEFLRALAGHPAFINEEVETGFIPKHFDELFPPLTVPTPEILAQAALFVVLRDHLQASSSSSPWISLASLRFGGDAYERVITLQDELAESDPATVRIKATTLGRFDIFVQTKTGETQFTNVPAELTSPTSISVTINSQLSKVTIVSQRPPHSIPASQSQNTMERIHVFNAGRKTTLALPHPNWLLSLGVDILIGKGSLKAPMPSLVVEVKVKVGDRVEKGQAVVVLESMKTETVLRSDVAGSVKAVACRNGEMVEEGKELVDIEPDVAEE